MTTQPEQFSAAYKRGELHARAEIELGNEAPAEEPLDEEDQRKLIFELTSTKVSDKLTFDQVVLVVEYEDGYYDEWEDHFDSKR